MASRVRSVVAALACLAAPVAAAALPQGPSQESLRPASVVGEMTPLVVALAAGSIALLVVLAWNRSLQREVRRRTSQLRAALEQQATQASILAQVTDAIILTGEDMRVTSWNDGAAALFGMPAGKTIGQPVGALITNRLAAARGGDLHEAIASGTDWRGVIEIVRPSGDTRFIETTLRRVTDRAGVPAGAIIVARDIDARRRAELDAEVRARHQAVIASLGQRALAGIDFPLLLDQAVNLVASTLTIPAAGIWRLTDESDYLLLAAGTGWEHPSELSVRVPVDAAVYPASALFAVGGTVTLDPRRPDCPPVDGFHAREGITAGAAVAIPGRSAPYGVLVVADRRERRFSRDDLHFLQAIGNVIGAAFERSVIDAELRSELALHVATVEAAADGMLVTDAAGRIRRYNQRLVDMCGSAPEIHVEPDADNWLIRGADRHQEPEARLADFRAAARSDLPQIVTLTLEDGRVVERHSQPQKVDGRIVGRVWCYRDVTERLRAEEERRRLESQMQHVQKLESLGVLAGGIAHDFNNLLVGMLGHAGLALQDLPADAPVHDSIVQIQTAAQRAAELTNQMLAYSGRGRFILQSTDLSAIVGEMTHLLRTAVSKNAEITLDLQPGLPAFDGDPAQIRQVIMNLITNASDALGTEPGRITIVTGRMWVTRQYVADAWVGNDVPEGEFVFAEVSDTGCGMDAATLARIFDPFFTTKFTGRGLGLAAVLGIVRGHHGAITIDSEPGRGTTFRVLLPATRTPAPVEVPPVRPAAERAAGARVLVVDDEAGVRAIAKASLKRAGFQVRTANDGAEAVAVLDEDGGFDAVLLDMTMPRMNGAETFRQIKARQPGLPVVLTSGYSAQDAVGRIGSDGIAAFIQKPFMPSALVQTMLEAIRRRGVS